MAGSSVVEGRDVFVRLGRRGLDLTALIEEADRALAGLVGFDSSCWLTFDPMTLLPTSHITSDEIGPELLLLIARNEYCEDDVNKFAVLARRTPPVGILSLATGGDRHQSARYREVLAPGGVEDELRAAFISDGVVWGGVSLHRIRGSFGEADAAAMAAAGSLLAEGIRHAIVATAAASDGRPDGPGLVIVDDGGSVVATTAAAQRWLAEIHGPRGDGADLPLVVHSVAERARAAGESSGAQARVPMRSGGWLMLHGSLLGDERPGRVALILEPARAPQIAPLIADAYGLSHREREVTALVLQGLSTGEIARALHLSPHTVQDHLKAIFAKFGLRSRRELVAHIFFRHYAPEIERGSAPAADGWFVDRAP